MAHFSLRNRDTGITIESHDFDASERIAMYGTYMPGQRILCGNDLYRVRTCAWVKASQEFIVGVTYEAPAPQPVNDVVWC